MSPHVWKSWITEQTSADDPIGSLARWVRHQQRQGCTGCASATPGALQRHLVEDHGIDRVRVVVAVDAARTRFARARLGRSDVGGKGGPR